MSIKKLGFGKAHPEYDFDTEAAENAHIPPKKIK